MKKEKKKIFVIVGAVVACLAVVYVGFGIFFRVISALEQPLTELKPVANQWKKLSSLSQRKSTAMC